MYTLAAVVAAAERSGSLWVGMFYLAPIVTFVIYGHHNNWWQKDE